MDFSLLYDDLLEVNDLCAAYLLEEQFWFRARVIDKSDERRVYRLRLIDFGDVHELPFQRVKLLDEEYIKYALVIFL